MIKELKNVDQSLNPEEIQTIVYTVGKQNGYEKNLRDWFRLIYEVVFGEENGPRMGFFISFFGLSETIDLIDNKIKIINVFNFKTVYIFSDPEVAHDLAIKSLKVNFLPKSIFKVKDEKMLETNLFEKRLPNPIGLAAGFDKSAEVYNSLFKFGFGFIEVGTVTPKKQLGNPKPRIFRLEQDKALINRLGFNNHGSEIIKKEYLRINLMGF